MEPSSVRDEVLAPNQPRPSVAAIVRLVATVPHGLAIRPPQDPRGVATDLQHRIVLFDGLSGFGQMDGGDGILGQLQERLPSLARPERALDTVLQCESWTVQEDPVEG